MSTNTSINFGPLFSLADSGFRPTLSRRQAIPAALASTPQPVVGLGMVKAMCTLLCHVNGVAIAAQAGHTPRWQIWLASSSSTMVHELGGDAATWCVKYQGYLVAIAGVLDALCARFPDHPAHGQADLAAFAQRWYALLDALTTCLQVPPPYTAAQLRVASGVNAANEAMMAACDALYAAMQLRRGQNVMVEELPAQGQLVADVASMTLLYSQTAAAPQVTTVPMPAMVTTSVIKTLSRAILRGRTALLVGPTGAGKTEAAKQAALSVGATLVKIEGHPGLDDKLLFGGVYPDGKGGFRYVEGPFSEAWRYAAEGKRVVLQLDELARMDVFYHAILIGALDCLTGAEIAARPKLAQAASQLPFPVEPAARYRVLCLPSGAVLIAPELRLSVIATTNLGSAYQQSATQLDPALVRRLTLRLEVERLEVTERRAILEHRGLPASVASALVSLEDFSVTNTASHGGLLQEALNLGVLLDWGQEAQALVHDGIAWPQALRDAAEYTAIPFACPRLADGRLEPPAVAVLRTEVINTVRSL